MLETLIKVGMLFQQVLSRLEHLERDIRDRMLIHHLGENFQEKYSDPEFEKTYLGSNRTELLKEIKPKIDQINNLIRTANRASKLLTVDVKVKPLKKEEVARLIDARLKTIAKKETERKLSDENFRLKLDAVFAETATSLRKVIEDMDFHKKFPRTKKLKENYRSGMKSAIDIMSIGKYKSSTFAAVRTVESALNDYLRLEIKRKNFPRIKLEKVSYENKVGQLWKKKLISEKLFHDLNSLRIDRNQSGHPTKKRFTAHDARSATSNGTEVIIRLQKKMVRIR